MDISWYRDKVANVPKYKSATWKCRVQKMSNAQILALYHEFKRKGLFDKRRKEVKKDSEKYYQYTIFDYMEDKNNG